MQNRAKRPCLGYQQSFLFIQASVITSHYSVIASLTFILSSTRMQLFKPKTSGCHTGSWIAAQQTCSSPSPAALPALWEAPPSETRQTKVKPLKEKVENQVRTADSTSCGEIRMKYVTQTVRLGGGKAQRAERINGRLQCLTDSLQSLSAGQKSPLLAAAGETRLPSEEIIYAFKRRVVAH